MYHLQCLLLSFPLKFELVQPVPRNLFVGLLEFLEKCKLFKFLFVVLLVGQAEKILKVFVLSAVKKVLLDRLFKVISAPFDLAEEDLEEAIVKACKVPGDLGGEGFINQVNKLRVFFDDFRNQLGTRLLITGRKA